MFVSLLSTTVLAQSKLLNINSFMGQKKRPEEVKEVIISGRDLRDYNLSLYHSYTLKLTDATRSMLPKIVEAVKADGKNAEDKEVAELGGQLYYAVYSLGEDAYGERRYIFFKNRSLRNQGNEVVVVYMEGKASLNQIKKQFKK